MGMTYFQLAWLGGPVAIAGLLWVVLTGPRAFRKMQVAEAPFASGPVDFLAELVVPEDSALKGLSLPLAEERYELVIHGVVRDGKHVFARRDEIALKPADIVLAEASLAHIDHLCAEGLLAHAGEADEEERIEAVVMPESLAIGSRLGDILALIERGVRITGLASRRHRVEGRFEELLIGMGDVLVLSGEREALREAVVDCGLLQLSGRRLTPPRVRAVTSVAFFATGILLTAFNIFPAEIAFGAVVLAMAAVGSLNLRSALSDLNWTIVILLACMIPLGIAVEDTGAAAVIANAIADQLPSTEPLFVASVVLLLAVTITPFIDNVSTAAVLSPIAAGLAARTGVSVEVLLMTVAIGASLDFLTPFGHHNNTVVMGAGGYRFLDFPRFGAPLLVVCLVTAILALGWVLSLSWG